MARHVMHLLSSIFSPADNGMLWQGEFLLSYAESERSCLGKWPVPPAERKRGKAAGRQQADTASLNVTTPLSAPLLSSLSTFSPPLSLFWICCLNSSESRRLSCLHYPPHATPSQRQRKRAKGEGGSGHMR